MTDSTDSTVALPPAVTEHTDPPDAQRGAPAGRATADTRPADTSDTDVTGSDFYEPL